MKNLTFQATESWKTRKTRNLQKSNRNKELGTEKGTRTRNSNGRTARTEKVQIYQKGNTQNKKQD